MQDTTEPRIVPAGTPEREHPLAELKTKRNAASQAAFLDRGADAKTRKDASQPLAAQLGKLDKHKIGVGWWPKRSSA